LTQPSKVTVQAKIGDSETTFTGTVEETWLFLNKFFSQTAPCFEIAKQLQLCVDVQTLAKDCEGIIAFSPEGANLMVPKAKLTDNEALTLWLLASYLGKKLNLLSTDALSKEELQLKLGKSSKITSTRLGELVKQDFAQKTADELFRITTFGVVQMQKDTLPRIIAKTGT
jgi:hypothetical protein